MKNIYVSEGSKFYEILKYFKKRGLIKPENIKELQKPK